MFSRERVILAVADAGFSKWGAELIINIENFFERILLIIE